METSTLLAEGEPAWGLHEEARSASLVVVGSWHLSKRRGMFSSASVALPLTAHASCPVVVVPEPEHIAQQPAYVVVGVDGSEHAAAAVDVAFEETALRRALLRALYVWHPPLLGALDEDAAVRECRRVLSETVAGRTAAHPDVELRHEVVRGHPVQVLTEALRLSKAGIDVIETVITPRSGAVGRALGDIRLPEGTVVATIVRDGQPTVPDPAVRLRAGDELLLVPHSATEHEIHAAFQ
ncbi:universal stress protein [Streptomyces sp. 13-12-16]|uniref:universal stress protein n=1 Tax=Streptomyces sp. 13-12-16 TaxID=1570823 RepID=UPI002119CAF6|nr:universal stress protein [Streptomyces sp. 13-12-16]